MNGAHSTEHLLSRPKVSDMCTIIRGTFPKLTDNWNRVHGARAVALYGRAGARRERCRGPAQGGLLALGWLQRRAGAEPLSTECFGKRRASMKNASKTWKHKTYL